MTVYERKNRRGQPTGKYIVEVVVAGKRYRETAPSQRLALAREAEMVAGVVRDAGPKVGQPVPPPVTPLVTATYTVANLQRDARNLWRGTKDEAQSLQRFNAVCDLLGADTPLAAVRTKHLEKLCDDLRDRSLSDVTVHRYLSALSKAMRYALKRDDLAGMPSFPWPKPGKSNSTVLDRDDETRLLAWLRRKGSPDVALVVDVLLATGARISEVLGVDPEDVDPEAELVTFRDTKNGDDRTVPLQNDLGIRLRALALVGPPTYRRINLGIHKARKALGIVYKVTPHVMRHTVGTRLDEAGVTVPTIMEQLGHRNERTTKGYVHPQAKTLRLAAAHLKRPVTPAVTRGETGGKTGVAGGNSQPRFEPQPLENLEASPRIELGYEDLQSGDNLQEVTGTQVLPQKHVAEGD